MPRNIPQSQRFVQMVDDVIDCQVELCLAYVACVSGRVFSEIQELPSPFRFAR